MGLNCNFFIKSIEHSLYACYNEKNNMMVRRCTDAKMTGVLDEE